MTIRSFYHQDTGTFTHVITDPATGCCAVIDSVLDYELSSGVITTTAADEVIGYIHAQGWAVSWILETHIHADHLTAAGYIQHRCGGRIGIGASITPVLKYWVPFFELDQDVAVDGSQFDRLFKEGDVFAIRETVGTVLETPGHTPSCVTYCVGDSLFVGDSLLTPTLGTARTDFPGGDPVQLYHSIQRLYAFPESYRIFVGHDYPKDGDPLACVTVQAQKAHNVLITHFTSQEGFVQERKRRDTGKSVPRLLYPAIQWNSRGGKWPPLTFPPFFFKIPVTLSL